MGFILRDYQQQAVRAGVDHLQAPKSSPGLMILPTGSGKSLVIANTVRELGGNALIFQPSREILEQNYFKYISYGEGASVYSASAGQKDISHVTYATIGSVYKKPSLFTQFDYFIFDECHKLNPEDKKVKGEAGPMKKGGMYKEFFKAVGTHKVLGLTATPYRLYSNRMGPDNRFITRTRPSFFKTVVYYVQNKTMFEEGYLCPLEYHQLQNFDRSKVLLNSSGMDYDEQSLKRYYGAIDFIGGVAKVVQRLLERGDRKRILVFTRFVEEAKNLAQVVPGSVVVSAETKDRDQIIRKFKAGKIPAICNVGVLTTGFDYPELDAVVIARPTLSLSLYTQMVGRVMRPHKDKKNGMVIDMCGNINYFGKIEDQELVDAHTRTPYIRGTNGQLTNVVIEEESYY